MLKPIENFEEEKGLMFVIEGKEWNLYRANSDLNKIKNEFVNCTTVKVEKKSNYKYIALTDSNDMGVNYTLAVTYDNKFIIEEDALNGKCIYPIDVKNLSNMISELADYYKNLGYEVIARRQCTIQI